MLAGKLKDKLRRREFAVGPLMTMDFWPGYVEVYKKAGVDFMILDLEHGGASWEVAADICRIGRLVDLPIIVRPETAVYYRIRKYLDMGAAGLMIPWVETAEQIQVVQDATFFAPKGRRGPGGPCIFGAPSLDRAGWEEVQDNICIFLQVETPAGIDAMTQIMAHDWIDAVILGGYDLALNSGRDPALRRHPDQVGAITKVIERAQALGKPCGFPAVSIDETMFWRSKGCSVILYSEAVSMVMEKMGEFMHAMQ